MTNKNILIIGGNSDIGRSISVRYAKIGYNIILASRNSDHLEKNKNNIVNKFKVKVTLIEFDILNEKDHTKLILELLDVPDIVICTVGLLGIQKDCEIEISSLRNVIRTNYEGPISILTLIANLLENKGTGTIVGISSIAGLRGRSSNYIYGSAKAGFINFLSGLRNRLSKKGVHVVTVIPGFVNTKMVKVRNLPNFLLSNPDDVANKIYLAVKKKKNIVIPDFKWKIISLILTNIPEFIFKRLNL